MDKTCVFKVLSESPVISIFFPSEKAVNMFYTVFASSYEKTARMDGSLRKASQKGMAHNNRPNAELSKQMK